MGYLQASLTVQFCGAALADWIRWDSNLEPDEYFLNFPTMPAGGLEILSAAALYHINIMVVEPTSLGDEVHVQPVSQFIGGQEADGRFILVYTGAAMFGWVPWARTA